MCSSLGVRQSEQAGTLWHEHDRCGCALTRGARDDTTGPSAVHVHPSFGIQGLEFRVQDSGLRAQSSWDVVKSLARVNGLGFRDEGLGLRV